jgi:hypothetical protein
MIDIEPESRAWPFLVARGRKRGYRTLLAPDFLVAEHGYGVLDDSVVPSTQEDQGSLIEVVTRAGRALTVVHATHLVTSTDIAEPGAEADDHEPRDRHSRPLQLIYGFVCVDARVSEAHPDDLAACRETALGVYRRFLDDEEGFTVEAGQEFVPRTRVTRRTPAPTRRLAPAPASANRSLSTPRPAPALQNLLLVSAILLVVVVLALMWFAWQKPKTTVVCPKEGASTSHTSGPQQSPCATPPEQQDLSSDPAA